MFGDRSLRLIGRSNHVQALERQSAIVRLKAALEHATLMRRMAWPAANSYLRLLGR
jgi:hypothetical protein